MTWVRQAEVDDGKRPGTTSAAADRIKELERENRELRRAGEILKAASAFFAPELDPRPPEELMVFIDENRERFGVEPICRAFQVARRRFGSQAATAPAGPAEARRRAAAG